MLYNFCGKSDVEHCVLDLLPQNFGNRKPIRFYSSISSVCSYKNVNVVVKHIF